MSRLDEVLAGRPAASSAVTPSVDADARDVPFSAAQTRLFLRAMGKRIRLTRVDRELSQQGLAERSGMSRNFVSSVERGAHGVDVVRLRALAWALGVRIEQLLPAEGPDEVTAQPPAQRPA